ncbi:SGNH/GDSL hydrolase family protein [Bacillus marasmi]|uniref:SGNH/GDSL hydrolase family protein n=1 Tax=Bacillus marasmi TaxID=1926279 RepID=UPI0011CCB731|nr:SGNH/GDSL hydrolase family protein [Bacillus marasmi]
MRNKSVLLVAITSVLASLICIVGLGITLFDYFDTPSKPIKKEVVNTEPKKDKDRVQIVALGDSLTRGTGDLEGKGYVGYLVTQLEEKTERKLALSNLGIKGLRSEQLVKQVKQEEIKRQVENADILLITIGGNDLFRGGEGLADMSSGSLQPIESAYTQNLQAIFTELRSVNKEAEIFFIGLYNPFIDLENAAETSKVVRAWNYNSAEISAGFPNTVFVPTFDLFQLNVNDYLFSDKFHPNTEGYQLIAERVASLITL